MNIAVRLLILFFALLALFLGSELLHEGVHWIQFSFDPDFKPVKITWLPAGTIVPDNDCMKGCLATIAEGRYNMTQPEFDALFMKRLEVYEPQAIAVQLVFLLIAGLVVIRKLMA